jgi:hypothetical protein
VVGKKDTGVSGLSGLQVIRITESGQSATSQPTSGAPTLSTLGLPLEGVGLLIAIDPILDMMRTATNVAGQAVVPILVAAREGILDRAAFAAPKGEFDLVEPEVAAEEAADAATADGSPVLAGV